MTEVHWRRARRDGAIGEILPGAEPTARSREHQHASRLLRLHALKRVANLAVHCYVEGVELLGAIERQPRIAFIDLEPNGLIAHVS